MSYRKCVPECADLVQVHRKVQIYRAGVLHLTERFAVIELVSQNLTERSAVQFRGHDQLHPSGARVQSLQPLAGADHECSAAVYHLRPVHPAAR